MISLVVLVISVISLLDVCESSIWSATASYLRSKFDTLDGNVPIGVTQSAGKIELSNNNPLTVDFSLNLTTEYMQCTSIFSTASINTTMMMVLCKSESVQLMKTMIPIGFPTYNCCFGEALILVRISLAAILMELMVKQESCNMESITIIIVLVTQRKHYTLQAM